ncbi:MAG: leucine-rich repeat domain-containing protein, partial [Lachnospiraceae bacterium]|nr:leucine-rich repeat domain-containing protein [Lachnospiraceae bacterium]
MKRHKTMHKLRKALAVLLALCLVLSFAPAALADDATSGTCGENVTWTLDTDTGVLTISGTGMMDDFESTGDNPWYSLRDSITSVIISDGVTSIGKGSFFNFTHLVNVTIPDSVESIGYGAFYGSGLTDVVIPDSVTSMGDYVFNECGNLSSVIIGNGVISIGYAAFEGCSSLTEITIGDSVTTIGTAAFDGCSSLTGIAIPASVTSIGSGDNSVFYGCTSLAEILVSADSTAYSSEDGILFNKDKTVLVCYPAGKEGSSYT